MQLRKRFGLVGETNFVPCALRQKLFVVKPYGNDDPFDYMVGKLRPNWRIQVKTCSTRDRHGMYHVNIGHMPYNPTMRRRVAYTPEEIDFFAIYLVPENRWYIVPVEVADGRTALCIHSLDHPKAGPWLPYLEAWHLLEQAGERPVLPELQPNAPTPRRRKFAGPHRTFIDPVADPFAPSTRTTFFKLKPISAKLRAEIEIIIAKLAAAKKHETAGVQSGDPEPWENSD